MSVEWRDMGLKAALKNLHALETAGLRVGVVGHADEQQESTGLTVGEVAYINEYGSVKAKIPARPFVKPALTPWNVMPIAHAIVGDSLDERPLHESLTTAGIKMAALVREKLAEVTASGGNAVSTIRKKGADTPLYETGLLSESISYQIVYEGAVLDAGFDAEDYESAAY